MSELSAERICGIGTEDEADRPPTYEEDPSFYDEPMSLEEEAGYPVTEDEYLDSQALAREIWPLYDDDGNYI